MSRAELRTEIAYAGVHEPPVQPRAIASIRERLDSFANEEVAFIGLRDFLRSMAADRKRVQGDDPAVRRSDPRHRLVVLVDDRQSGRFARAGWCPCAGKEGPNDVFAEHQERGDGTHAGRR